ALIDPPLPEGAISRLGSTQWRGLGEYQFPMSFLADNRTVVVQGFGAVRSVDFDTGAVRWELSNQGGDAYVAHLPDGRMVVWQGKTLRIHESVTGKELRQVACEFQPYYWLVSNGTL